jgi:hypothetical protein
MHALPPERIASLMDAYLLAHYRWENDGEWRWLRVGELSPELESAFPLAQRFALLSAWDPQSVVRDKALNRREDAELHRLLVDGAFNVRAAFSSAPDRTWREPSWLVLDIDNDSLDALGRRFGQLATLSWERGRVVRLRMDAAAPAGFGAFPCVDWLK